MIFFISSTFFPDFQTALSSANCDRSAPYLISRLCSFCLSESPITLISVWLSTAPWGDPFSCSWKHSSLIFTQIFLSVKKSLIHFKVQPFMPYSVSLSMTPDLHMRSKAFCKSRNTAKTFCFHILDVRITLTSLTNWSSVDLPFRKPDWVSASFGSYFLSNLLLTIVSMVLHMADVSEIG